MSPPWQLRNAVQYRKFLRSRFADGTPRSLAQPFATKERYGCGIPLAGACPTTVDCALAVGRDHWARRGQELPSGYKFVCLYRLPLRGRLGHVPALQRCGVIWGCVKNVSENSQFVLDFLRKLVIIYLALGVEEC